MIFDVVEYFWCFGRFECQKLVSIQVKFKISKFKASKAFEDPNLR